MLINQVVFSLYLWCASLVYVQPETAIYSASGRVIAHEQGQLYLHLEPSCSRWWYTGTRPAAT